MNELKDKIAQMCLIGIKDKKDIEPVKRIIKDYHIGGVIIYKNNYSNYDEMITLIKDLKEANLKNEHPLFIAIDQEGGRVNRMPIEIKNICSAFKLGETNDLNIISSAGDITGKILHKSGINMNFAPVMDINMFKNNHAIGDRSFSKNADLVSLYGLKYMEMLNKNNVISVLKHFPGQGACQIDSHKFLPIIKNYENHKSMHLYPFIKAIKNNAEAIMVGHILIKNKTGFLPSSISPKFIQKELRSHLKYKGLIMTDELSMKSVQLIYGKKRSIKLAFMAGNDMLCYKYYKNIEHDLIDSVYKHVIKGIIKEKSIGNSYKKIISLKEKYKITDKINNKALDIEKINKKIEELNFKVDNYSKTL